MVSPPRPGEAPILGGTDFAGSRNESESALGTLISNSGWPSSQAMTQEGELLNVLRLPLFAAAVAALCCAVAITAFVVQSPARRSAPERVVDENLSRTIDRTMCERFR